MEESGDDISKNRNFLIVTENSALNLVVYVMLLGTLLSFPELLVFWRVDVLKHNFREKKGKRSFIFSKWIKSEYRAGNSS